MPGYGRVCVRVCAYVYRRGTGGMGEGLRERDEFGESTVREGVT